MEILAAYWASGRKVRKVAARFQVSPEIIRRWETLLLGSAEFIFKDKADRKLEVVVAYYASGNRIRLIAEKYGVSAETIRQWALQLDEASSHVFGSGGSVGEILRLRRTLAKRDAELLELDGQLRKYQTLHGTLEDQEAHDDNE
jgi:transposase-like protein